MEETGKLTKLIMAPLYKSNEYYLLKKHKLSELEKMELIDKALLTLGRDSLNGIGVGCLVYAFGFSSFTSFMIFGCVVGRSFKKINNFIQNEY